MRATVRHVTVGALMVLMAGACTDAGSSTAGSTTTSSMMVLPNPADGTPTTAASTPTATAPPTSTTTTPPPVAPATGTVPDMSGAGLHEIPDYGFALHGPHVRSTFAPATGWVVTRSPGDFGVWFPGIESPDTLAIGGEVFEGTGGKDWGASVELAYEQGVNNVPIVVTRGTETTEVSVPVTYLPEATVTLARVAAVDPTSISLDYGYWDADREFPSPADDDVGVVETVAVAPNAYVILDASWVADYAWFVTEYEQQSPHDDLGWHPGREWTVYWATIDRGRLVELWHIPVG